MAQILLFNPAGEKLGKIRFLAMRLGIFTVEVPASDFGKTLAVLTGREDDNGAFLPALPFAGEMLVMDGLDSNQFHGLLDGLRREGAPIALKAVVTEQNLQWSAARLFMELSAEHAAMQRAAGSKNGFKPKTQK